MCFSKKKLFKGSALEVLIQVSIKEIHVSALICLIISGMYF